MRIMRWMATLFGTLALLAPGGLAQERPKPAEESKPVIPLKVHVVLNEFDGERRISSLPYTVIANADDRARTSLRMGLRVPVALQGKDNQFQYIDVGTDLDCLVKTAESAGYRLELTIRRSSLYAPGADRKSFDWSPGDSPLGSQPIVRQFNVNLSLLVRDGQTVQSTVATDPVSGRVLKVDATVSTAK